MKRVQIGSLVLLGLWSACTATNTGNPGIDNAPAGIDLVRSHLSRVSDPKLSTDERDGFGRDSRDFALAMYHQVSAADANVFFSPYSISVALGMTYAGAKGETKTEMASALHFALPEPTLHAAFNATDVALQGRAHELASSPGTSDLPKSTGDGMQLQLTNAAFGRKGLSFVPTYLDVLASQYDAGMFLADFANHAERERMSINQWVEDQTHMRIQELLPTGSLSADAALVLVNAVYFKASWLAPFPVKDTVDAPFHAPSGDVTVPMMHSGASQYMRADGYQALELQYISPDVRMLFILPDAGRFAAVEASLDRAMFDKVRTGLGLSRYNVDLKVPRFSFDASFALKDALQALGMKRAFGAGADLSGIAGAPGDLYIDEVYHKAFVAVDEQGTEAAAATAVVIGEVSLPPPAEFFLDRPFIFAIYDQPTGQILFMGRLMNPGH